MANILDKVKTIVLLMFENRSFNHILGHLSLQNINPNVRGLKEPLANFRNTFDGEPFPVFPIREDFIMDMDLPHKKDEVIKQLKKNDITGNFTMDGFVEAYQNIAGGFPNRECEPMGFFNSDKIPITSFLAQNFCTCDNWFTPLPTGTQPNRNMAFSGDSRISENSIFLRIGENNIFDWLNRANTTKKVRWRVYDAGLSYFILYPSLLHHVIGKNFRPFDQLARDIKFEPEEDSPEVIIIEPVYKDAPRIPPVRANDNHPPLAMGFGEEFLRRTYEALSSNPKKWESTVFIVYYDEHGGFYDHVPPPKIGYKTGDGHQFESMGPRVPAIVASPLVKQGSVSHRLFDHTSILQFLAEKFTPGVDYSDSVKSRRIAGVESISTLLDNETPFPAPLAPSTPIKVHDILGSNIAEGPQTEVAEAFEMAISNMFIENPEQSRDKFPELVQWKISADNAIENCKKR